MSVETTAPPGEREAVTAVPVRHHGRYIAAVIAIALFAAIIHAFSQGKINWGAVPDYFLDRRILDGVGQTLILTVLSMAIGIIGGIILAVMRLSKNPVTSSISWFYIWFFRGTRSTSASSSSTSTSARSTRTNGPTS